MNCLRKLPSPLSCPLSSPYYPRTRPPFSTTVRIVFKCSQQHSANPFNNSCPTILFYTASTAGFRRYIVCIPIYPYSLISILFFLNFCMHTPSTFCGYHTLESLPSLLPFYSVSLAIDFLVFLLYFNRFRLRIQSARAQPLQRHNSPPSRSRAHPFARVAPSAPFVACFQQHQPHAGTINLVTTSIIMLFDSTAGRMRMRLHSRWKA